MKASDYIVSYLENRRIQHVFGYPGGMITHFMDSLSKSKNIKAHLTYHEQGAAFAACGYAQITKNPTVAFATSGPGATNMITGICNAWFDSIPTIFITGQVNVYEGKGNLSIRQRGFQETDIISIVKSITKYAVYIDDVKRLPYELDKAYNLTLQGRWGPVLLDIPMNVFSAEIELCNAEVYTKEPIKQIIDLLNVTEEINEKISCSKRPCFIIGNGAHCVNSEMIISLVEKYNIPVVTSMPAVDILPTKHRLNYGFIGAYGNRTANTIIEKSDLLVTFGTRLDGRQTGTNRDWFATKAQIMRIDIDDNELKDPIKSNEIQIKCDLINLIPYLTEFEKVIKEHDCWIEVCDKIRDKLYTFDEQIPTKTVRHISKMLPNDCIVTTDVGQNQVWVAQAFDIKEKQRVLFSSGHGAMGYSLPAAIGACLATGKIVISFNGDGGLQMNIQELQTISREKLPIKIIVLNNQSLGMIRHFQEMYFESNFMMTVANTGYTVPDFVDIAKAYKIDAIKYNDDTDDECFIQMIRNDKPCLIEVLLENNTYTKPKSVYNRPLSYQEPLLTDEIQNWINRL